jgi:hypothetical protein
MESEDINDIMKSLDTEILPPPIVEQPDAMYAKTVCMIEKVGALLLAGCNAEECLQHVREEFPDVTYKKVYRMRRLVQSKIKEEADKSLIENYKWVYQNYKRMFKESVLQGDIRLQGAVLKDFCRLTGLDIDRVEQKVLVEDPQDVLDKLDNLLQ